jgi:hypothetical protein
MNFRRGKQMIVYDTGLSELGGYRAQSRPLSLPVAYRRWVLHPHNSSAYILRRVAMVASEADGGLDAVHFMGHGGPGRISLGRDGLSRDNVDSFSELAGNVRFIVFFSCQVGGEHQGGGWHRGQPTTFGRLIVQATGASVVVAQQNQGYDVGANGQVEFGAWDGPIDVYEPGGRLSTHQAHDPFHPTRRFNLEETIFG